jgi:transposase
VTGSATITGVGKRAAECLIADMRGRHDRVPDRRSPGLLGGPLPRQQPHRGQASLGQAHKGNRWLADVLTECAWAAARSRDTYLAAQFWRLARRIGKQKAAIAVGHSILVICWYLLDGDCDDHELGGNLFIRRDSDRARQRAVAQLQALGYQVTLQPAA